MTNNLELEMRELCRDLYNEKVAFMFKVPEEMTQTPCDFFGWTANGIAVAIECKSVKRKTLPICETSNGLKPHQWNALELADKCGAHSILVWRNGDKTCAMTFREVVMLSSGRKSVEWPTYAKPDWKDSIRAFVQSSSGRVSQYPQCVRLRRGDLASPP